MGKDTEKTWKDTHQNANCGYLGSRLQRPLNVQKQPKFDGVLVLSILSLQNHLKCVHLHTASPAYAEIW